MTKDQKLPEEHLIACMLQNKSNKAKLAQAMLWVWRGTICLYNQWQTDGMFEETILGRRKISNSKVSGTKSHISPLKGSSEM